IVAVDFRRVEAGGIFHDLGRVTFADNARKLTLPYREVRMNQDQKLWNFQARAVTIHGEVSGWSTIDVPLVPTAATATEVPWAVWGEYQRVDQIEVPGQGSRYCQTHLIPPPEFIPPDEHPGITVEFLPPEGTVQYKLYARIDDGPLTLVHEDSGEFNPLIPVFVAVELL